MAIGFVKDGDDLSKIIAESAGTRRRVTGAATAASDDDIRGAISAGRAAFIERVWRSGWRDDDFTDGGEIRPDIVIVKPLRPPKKTRSIAQVKAGVDGGAGLILPDSVSDDVIGTICLLHEVVARGPYTDRAAPAPEDGDLVLCQLSHLDPLHESTDHIAVDRGYIYRVFALEHLHEVREALRTVEKEAAARGPKVTG